MGDQEHIAVLVLCAAWYRMVRVELGLTRYSSLAPSHWGILWTGSMWVQLQRCWQLVCRVV